MASPASAVALIEAAIDAGITLDIAWPNVPFDPPSDGAAWLKVDFIWGIGTIHTKDAQNLVTGLLQMAVFEPKQDRGDGAAYAYAETARDLFNRAKFAADIWFGAASGPVTRFEENWRSLVVSVPFTLLETVT